MKKTSKSRARVKTSILIIFLTGIAIGTGMHKMVDVNWLSFDPPAEKLNICFTPPSGCGTLIAREISKAKESIYVQAFGLTSESITSQLIKAKNNGVKVEVLLDRSNLTDKHSRIYELKRAGITVAIDKVQGIAHNKVMIIDRSKVITGSFNFTNSADKRNTENVVLIDDSEVANAYLKNWLDRRAKNY